MGAYPGADFPRCCQPLVVVIIGASGACAGLVGSLVVGLLDTFGRALFPELAMFTIFAPMAIIPRQAARLVREGMRMRRVLPGVGLALGVLCLAIVVRLLPSYYIGLLTEALIWGSLP